MPVKITGSRSVIVPRMNDVFFPVKCFMPCGTPEDDCNWKTVENLESLLILNVR